MKYALGFDSINPAILFSANFEWLSELVQSESCQLMIGQWASNLVFSTSRDSFGFNGVMKPTNEKCPIGPESFIQYRIDLPVFVRENVGLKCMNRMSKRNHRDCPRCFGTGHVFESIPDASAAVGLTLSVITRGIESLTAESNYSADQTGVTDQPLEVVYDYGSLVGDHFRIRFSKDALNTLKIAGAIMPDCPLASVCRAIRSAYNHMALNTFPEPAVEMKMIDGDLCVSIDSGTPVSVTKSSNGGWPTFGIIFDSKLSLAVMAGISELYSVLYAGGAMVKSLYP